jgi:hypothetical protein
MLKQTIGGSTYMGRIKFLLVVASAMATLLEMAATPAVANDWEDRWDNSCVGVVRDGECVGTGSVDRWDGWDRWGD